MDISDIFSIVLLYLMLNIILNIIYYEFNFYTLLILFILFLF